MKKFVVTLVCLLMAGLSIGWCEDATKKPVALVAVGDVDDALVKDVQSWAEANLALPVPVLEKQTAVKGLLDEQARAVAKLIGPDDLGLVALVWPVDDVKNHGVIIKEDRVVVVNVRAMKEGAADDKMWTWRVERQALRGIGMLLDLQPCPDPFCTLTTYGTLEDLDKVGRNFCPPCLLKIQERVTAGGIELLPGNPYNMMGTGE